MDNWLIYLSSAATGLAGWLAGKRKATAETDNIVLRNLEDSVNLYKLIIDRLRDEIRELHQKMDKMEAQVQQLQAENAQLRKLVGKE